MELHWVTVRWLLLDSRRVYVECESTSGLKPDEKLDRDRRKDENDLEEYEWFAIYFIYFTDEEWKVQGSDVLFRKTESVRGLMKGNLGDEIPVRMMEPIFGTDAFRGTGVEEKVA